MKTHEKIFAEFRKLSLLSAVALAGTTLFADPATLWVDCASTAATPNGSEAAPYPTIQAAVDAAKPGDTVKVRPGVYDQGETQGPGASGCRVVIDKAITVEAAGSKYETIILGSKGAGGNGLGGTAVRCVAICSGAAAVVKGFTLADGHTHGAYDDRKKTSNSGGGVLVTTVAKDAADADVAPDTNKDGAFIVDCVIRDCAAYQNGGAVVGGNCVRCLFLNGYASGASATYFSCTYNCVFYEDAAHMTSAGSMLQDGTHVGATVFKTAGFFVRGKTTCYQCVFVGDAVAFNELTSTYKKTMLYCTFPVDQALSDGTKFTDNPANLTFTSGNFESTSSLYNPTIGDFRLVSALQSEAPTGATGLLGNVPEAYRDVDFNHNPLPTDKADPCYAGAIQEVCSTAPSGRSVTVSAGDLTNGLLSVDGNLVILDGSVYLKDDRMSVTGAGIAGFRFVCAKTADGAECYPDPDGTLVFAPKADADVTLSGVFMKPVWADAEDGNDTTGDGSEAKPYQSLQMACNKAVEAEDTRLILAKPGDYKTVGSKPGASDIDNVLYVAAGQNLYVRSISGKGNTFISGAVATTGADKYGNGTDAVRCVYMTKGLLQGFTIRGGRTSADTSAQTANTMGGGIYAGDHQNLLTGGLTVRDCTITDCSAPRAGMAYGGNFQNCRFVDCTNVKATMIRAAGLIRQCHISGGNDSNPYIQDCTRIESCTVVVPCGTVLQDCQTVVNSVFHRRGRSDTPSWAVDLPFFTITKNNLTTTVSFCAYDDGATFTVSSGKTGSSFVMADCVDSLTDADFVVTDWNPVKTADYVDVGNAGFGVTAWLDTVDLVGGKRIANGVADMGAIEYDWFADYAKDLGKGVTVTSAPSSATEPESGDVRLVDGTLTLNWTRSGPANRKIDVNVDGTGTLEIAVNGVMIASCTAGARTVSFDSVTGTDAVAFTYTPGTDDLGGAVICGCRRESGLMLLFK